MLEQRGIPVWFDDRLAPGAHFDFAIEAALAEATTVVVFWSQNSSRSRWVRAEAGDGLERGILVPVLIEDTIIPLEFRRVQTLDLREWKGSEDDENLEQLVKALRTDKAEARTAFRGNEKRRVRIVPSHPDPAVQASDSEIARRRLSLAVGPNFAFYEQAWATMDRRHMPLSWNWSAFFSGCLGGAPWLGYRKMWGLAGLMFFTDFLITGSSTEPGASPLIVAVATVAWIIPGVFLGAFGNAIYRWRINRLLERAMHSEWTARQLGNRGGVYLEAPAFFGFAHAAFLIFALWAAGAFA